MGRTISLGFDAETGSKELEIALDAPKYRNLILEVIHSLNKCPDRNSHQLELIKTLSIQYNLPDVRRAVE